MTTIKTSKSNISDNDIDAVFRASKRLKTETNETLTTMTYDRATIEFRTRDCRTNFPCSDHNIRESNFQNLYTVQDVLSIVNCGSYQSMVKKDERSSIIHGDFQFTCIQLFRKELTPSDVGKLNRLVIPKRHAIKHFPCIQNNHQRLINGGYEDLELIFYDKSMKTWKFRYCYCRSSQSFVFTRGWSRFVKDKKLRERDVIVFYACECPDEQEDGVSFFLIDVNYINGEGENREFQRKESSSVHHDQGDLHVDLGLNLGKKFCCKLDNDNENNGEHCGFNGLKSSDNVKRKNVTLFGAQIN
ncbi:Detected protein of unknown function [Hibiscus syriacus]|uniref:TF-B3 domain-containing protein n=1 Tax=Hibiscus syriacus TaxID=106335 RepID=A0A6A2XD97_HIBSY|nr:AP2/ERF and B3 domain-containing transcription factor At1g51120-like [Hibiscus syriacus]KAE8673623.1 Detected protein of unknown function [Hibiscus syriacus]